MKFHVALLMCLVSIKCDSLFSYDGCKVYEIDVKTENDANFLKSIDGRDGFDFWSMTRLLGVKATLMVKPEQQSWFEKSLVERKIQYGISITDLEKTFITERQYQLMRRLQRSSAMTFDRYYQHDEINGYLENLQINSLKNPLVRVKNVGQSYEGRDIKTITITNGDGRKKNSIFIDAGIHAREWIAPATALYVIDQLVDPQSKYSRILNEVDFVIMPVVNPDGYEYTHKRERLWRKTRSKNGISCTGTDGNRNFDFHWGEVGASANSCSETFRGKKAFSEAETQVLRDTVIELKDSCKFYLTLHSYGNYMLYPWGWTSDLPESWKDLDEISRVGADAIYKKTGTNYTVGSSTNVLYAAAGGSDDFMFGVGNIPISITMELPGGGRYGFDPPASSIQRMVEESAVGIFAMSEAVARKYNKI